MCCAWSVLPSRLGLHVPAAYRVGGVLSEEHLESACNLRGAAPRQLLLRCSTSCIPAVVRIPAPAAYRVGGSLRGAPIGMACQPERLRAAHPCALSRNTVHPEHKKGRAIARPFQSSYLQRLAANSTADDHAAKTHQSQDH